MLYVNYEWGPIPFHSIPYQRRKKSSSSTMMTTSISLPNTTLESSVTNGGGGGGSYHSNNLKLLTELTAVLYVFSGVCQPLIMTQVKNAGLADPTAQLYMVFYYLGPCLLFFVDQNKKWPPWSTRWTAMAIAVFDVFAQVMNYTGIMLAGPTIFAIVYSSVTIWTAVWARFVLARKLSFPQWGAICIVFLGLTLTATDSLFKNNKHDINNQQQQQQHDANFDINIDSMVPHPHPHKD
jgi:small-conductance mechanosensitive channel